jgi:signal transduction histidine kinase
VRGDRALLRRLLANLIENAVRYTPKGGEIHVRAARRDDTVRLAVCDTGVGIDQAEQDRVFDRFYRAEQSRSRETGGAGLGLSICRRIVELHGGTIRIDSEKTAGTTVTVDLPSGPAPSSPA